MKKGREPIYGWRHRNAVGAGLDQTIIGSRNRYINHTMKNHPIDQKAIDKCDLGEYKFCEIYDVVSGDENAACSDLASGAPDTEFGNIYRYFGPNCNTYVQDILEDKGVKLEEEPPVWGWN